MNFLKKYKKKYDYLINTIKKEPDLDEIITHYLSEIIDQDEKKIEVLKDLLKNLLGTSLVEGLKIIDCLSKTKNIKGDICEFGVAQGKTSKLIAYFIKDSNKKLFLIDSFQGLPKPTDKDLLKDDIFSLGDIKKYEGRMSNPEAKVLHELNDIKFDKEKLIINKGFFNSKSMDEMNLPTSVSFAYLDFDFYQPTLDGLNYLNKVLNVGGMVIIDDYDFFSTGVKTSVEEWFKINSKSYSKDIVKTKSASFVILEKIS